MSATRLDEAFPAVEPPFEATGPWVLVQDRVIAERSKGGVILTDETRDNRASEAVAKVCSIGPLAGRNGLGEQHEGWPWFTPGDHVLVPRYSSARYQTTAGVVFRALKSTEIFGLVTNLDEVLR
jgi:co-chaperonin GroES (HSP10)